MNKIRLTIAGYGNVGRGVSRAVKYNTDMSLNYIITRDPQRVIRELNHPDNHDLKPTVLSENERESIVDDTDVILLCGGSKNDLPKQGPKYIKYFNTVDSFDTHERIPEYAKTMGSIARKNKHVAVISAGWDPGTFSLHRLFGDAFIQGSSSYTFWGKGVSQGHSDAVRKIRGVEDARQYTIPIEDAMERVRRGENPKLMKGEKHRRQVFVVLANDTPSERDRVVHEIVTMPNYFAEYPTEVQFIDREEMKKSHSKYPHGGFVMTTGKTGDGNNAIIEYVNKWDSNPEATGSTMLACARAAVRLNNEGRSGAFTMFDIPPLYYSPLSRDELLRRFL